MTPVSARLAVRVWLCAALLLSPGEGTAQGGPRPPCGAEPSPAYAEPVGSPVVRVWSEGELGADWTPPACTGWRPLRFRALVAAAAAPATEAAPTNCSSASGPSRRWRPSATGP